MLELALNYNNKPLSVSVIGENEQISPKFLSQIIIPLKGAGLILSIRGAHGGYVLSRAPEEIRLFEIYQVLEGDSSLVECVHDRTVCDRVTTCVVSRVWGGLSSMVEVNLKSITLKDLVTDAEKLTAQMTPIYQI